MRTKYFKYNTDSVHLTFFSQNFIRPVGMGDGQGPARLPGPSPSSAAPCSRSRRPPPSHILEEPYPTSKE
ncbi:hypothetical protein HanRHA438_Chr09g0384401 [Helianthus annuus]|nr:hypothetical protein HanRHA438_Chr09g0384401 [Helianthus annuus]